jgi:3-dehydroquinate synthase
MSVQQSLTVDLGKRSYDIIIGTDLLSSMGKHLKSRLPGKQVAIITNETVGPRYLERLSTGLKKAGFDPLVVIIHDGETHKNWASVQRILDRLIEHRFERSATLLALGGGVVGDITGFAASILLRGVHFIQVPTTLLAQVDASVGGKTGINHAKGKNLIGTFHQPRRVVIDLDTLHTLPPRELRAGLAEALKYGLILDDKLVSFMEDHLEAILSLHKKTLGQMVYACCQLKAKVVQEDEQETLNLRALLNLGHTFGHGIEVLTHYGQLLHGEAVAIGMVMAADLSHRLALIDEKSVQRITTLIQRMGLPIQAPRFSVDHFMEAMTRDKKVEGGRMRFVLINKIGHGIVEHNVSEELVRATLIDNMARPGKIKT